MQNGIEREAFSLQRVHHLVGHHHPQLSRVRPFHTKQGSRIGIVVPRNLFGIQLQQQRPEIQRIGQEAEQSISGLQPLELGRRQFVIQLAEQVLPHLRPGPKGRLRRGLEPEPGGLFHPTSKAVHQSAQRIGTDRLGALAPATSGKPNQKQQMQGRDSHR